jgi:hypothetical protein
MKQGKAALDLAQNFPDNIHHFITIVAPSAASFIVSESST